MAEKDLLGGYIGIDFSQTVLDTLKQRIAGLFSNDINWATYVGDFAEENIKDLVGQAKEEFKDPKLRNMICFIGSTIENQTNYFKALKNVKDTLNSGDLFLIGETLNTEKFRNYFNFSVQTGDQNENIQELWIPHAMGITPDLYEPVFLFDESDGCRKMFLEIKEEVQLDFKQEVFKLCKGDRILVWHHKHHYLGEIVQNYTDVGLSIKAILTSKDMAQALVVCELA